VSLTVRAPAKINLYLGVGPVRADGYHPLSTVYQAIGLYDDVTVTDAPGWSVSVVPTGDVDCAAVPLDETNLAMRAGALLARQHGVDRAAQIEIRKGIPVAGGLAGGSADAAATLVALDRLWGLETTDEAMLALAAALGSDVPFALVGGTAHGTGRGEHVEPVTDRGDWWWVVVPDDHGLSTPEIYAAFDRLSLGEELRTPEGLLGALLGGDPDDLAVELFNALEPAALAERPQLDRTRTLIRQANAHQALLSGSGPTMLGLAGDAEHAREVAEVLLRDVPRVYLAPGPVAGAHVVEYT
jgi:4-diphosphocytidyl-2-C-methyl-D-erythritol kinase